MKKFTFFVLLLLTVAACSVENNPVAEQSAAEVVDTAVPPTPTLNIPRLEEEPAPPTAVPTEPPAATAAPTEEPTATTEPPPTETAVATAEAVAEEVEAAGGVVYGRTPEGAFFQGDPNAPITMIDFSDFL